MIKVKTFLPLAAFSLILSSCLTDSATPLDRDDVAKVNYANSFIEAFGRPVEGHDWGATIAKTAIIDQSLIDAAKQDDGSASTLSRGASIKGSNPGAPNWWKIVGEGNIPAPVTDEERQKAIAALENSTADDNIAINFCDYFVQQVYYSGKEYATDKGKTIDSGKSMGQLYDALGEAIKGFHSCSNVSKAPVKTGPGGVDYKDEIMLMTESSTANFGYKNTIATDADIYSNATVGNVTRTIEVDGAYYVGFNFFVNSDKGKGVEGDGIFTDWIIRITPVNYQAAARVMVEDLGSGIGSDYDFNDIVFDAVIAGDEAVITLQAAGGTKEVYIGDPAEGIEPHKLFGVELKYTINTHPNTKRLAPIMVRLKGYTGKDVTDIPIYVKNDTEYKQVVPVIGKAPIVIYTTPDCDWSPERVRIDTTYPKFKDYVKDPTLKFWE